MTLRFKLFAAFFTLIVLPLFLSGIAAYSVLSGATQDKYSRQAEITLRALYQSVDFIFQEMNKVTDSTIANAAVQEVLTKPESDVTEIDYLRLNEVQRNFRDLLINHPSVSFAFMYSLEDGRIIPIYLKDSFKALPFDEFKQQKLYREVLGRKGLPKWVGPYEYPNLTGSDPVFTQIRVVKDIPTLSDKGILLVQIKNSALEKLFSYFSFKPEKYQTRFLIVSSEGLVLFDSSYESHGRRLTEYMKEPLPTGSSYQSKRLTFAGVDSILSSIPLTVEDWRLVSVAPWSSLSRDFSLYATRVGAIIAICLLCAFIFLLFFVNRIAGIISRIVQVMRRVEQGELNIKAEESGNDELKLLAVSLNSMIGQIRGLLGRVKREQERKNRAEMRVLQAQIKPHFLFNTLESINVLAVQNEGRKVSQMVLRLASILRISIHGPEEISLRQEIEHLVNYLEIQRFRFADVFEYTLDIPEELLGHMVQKLTLQPLVENSIQHGFDGLSYKGNITVRAEENRGRLVLTVSDNGIGITNEVLETFQYMDGSQEELDGAQERLNDPIHFTPHAAHNVSPPHNLERRGLGVRSVADRIRIQYGAGYGLFICSAAGSGTIIKCILPMTEYQKG
ncbi:MAG: sensor histidine kinase [Gorillibacterium sp.]|nr:sensor histidine kinase [Gorillibacterium sp.]